MTGLAGEAFVALHAVMVSVFQGGLYAALDPVTVRQMVHAEEESSGVWESFNVIFSPNNVVKRQGEPAAFRFRALTEGISPVRILSAHVMGENRYPMDQHKLSACNR